MLTLSEIARIALRYDTPMSHAMLRALGIEVSPVPRNPGQIVEVSELDGVDPDIEWCFENHGSPMDRVR